MPPALFPQPLLGDVRLHVLLMLVTLSLGVVTGTWLAGSPEALGDRGQVVADDPSDTFSARSRRLSRVSSGDEPGPESIVGRLPTRHSVQAEIDAVDPRGWLDRYGTVVEAPLAAR